MKIYNTLTNKKEEFIPTPSALCNWCGYKKMCPMWKHQFQSQTSNLKSQKDLEPIIEEYFTLKDQNSRNNKQIKTLQASMGDFMDQEGVERVFGENGYITRIMQEREVFDTKKAQEILENIGQLEDLITKKQFPVFKSSHK